MVLHNSKWDKKAKYKYLKKHGLLKKPQRQQLDANQKTDEPSYEDQDNEKEIKNVIDSEEDTSGSEDNERAGGKLGDVADITVENELPLPSSSDDEDFLEYTRLTKNINHTYVIDNNAKRAKQLLALKKPPEELTFEDLANLELDPQSDSENGSLQYKKRGSETKDVNILSDSDLQKFKELQKKIEKDKIYRNIKEKFKVKPKDTQENQNDQDSTFDENLMHLLGNPEKLPHDQISDTSNEDIKIESSLDSQSLGLRQTSVNRTGGKMRLAIKNTSKQEDEKALDDLLGL